MLVGYIGLRTSQIKIPDLVQLKCPTDRRRQWSRAESGIIRRYER